MIHLLFYVYWKKESSWGRGTPSKVGSHLDALEHIMISLLNAALPHGEALLIWLLDTLCRMHKGFKLANRLASPKPQGSENTQASFFFCHRRRPPYLHTVHCLSLGSASRLLLSPTLTSEIIYSIAGLSATSHYMARTVSHRKVWTGGSMPGNSDPAIITSDD